MNTLVTFWKGEGGGALLTHAVLFNCRILQQDLGQGGEDLFYIYNQTTLFKSILYDSSDIVAYTDHNLTEMCE